SPAFMIATWFGTGLIIPSSGTWGTIGGMLFGVPLLSLVGPYITLGIAAFLFILGIWATQKLESQTTEHDASFIVIDEVVAILMVLALLPISPLNALIGFALFRLFDIVKPWPINWVDQKISGAWGVMLDDVLAALFAVATFYVLHNIWQS
ncbi:MAG: phosphatidylglycerophosphatase A, partial [Pseudomonadota bacterium]